MVLGMLRVAQEAWKWRRSVDKENDSVGVWCSDDEKCRKDVVGMEVGLRRYLEGGVVVVSVDSS